MGAHQLVLGSFPACEHCEGTHVGVHFDPPMPPYMCAAGVSAEYYGGGHYGAAFWPPNSSIWNICTAMFVLLHGDLIGALRTGGFLCAVIRNLCSMCHLGDLH